MDGCISVYFTNANTKSQSWTLRRFPIILYYKQKRRWKVTPLGTKLGGKTVWAYLVGRELIFLKCFARSFWPRKEEGSL